LIDYSLINIENPSKCINRYDLAYLAPEAVLSAKSDIWSLGCILYELVSNGEKLINNLSFHKMSPQGKGNFIE
jgi:serine/threonine protein kinase